MPPITDASACSTKLTIQHPTIHPAVAQARSGPNWLFASCSWEKTMLLATLHTGVATSACICAQIITATSLQPHASEPQVMSSAALVAAVSQRSSRTGECF